ncbi:guanitoxin biosynthesis heme-dependent pre-guanitoxin N-hydroxylase GntA [Qipengyuania marisflavi]|uniref:guanitoxin biosynthesis heme-dependent pre-guanitoxin N-hydroxylase GntA n=1 Tax=Qipengyuania marisflavi TaxID=2486356 RepID=UPI003CCC5AFC
MSPRLGREATSDLFGEQAGIDLAVEFRDFIRTSAFPCVGAKSALGRNQMTAYVGNSLTSAWDDLPLADELIEFAAAYRQNRSMFQTFVAFFPNTPTLDEEAFEQALWDRIQSLQAKDEWLGQEYDSTVSADPASPNFSLSFGGMSFFVVGMHHQASRPARRFRVTTLVFNLHDQFHKMRAEGKYEKLRVAILERDKDLAGSINPMLARHGERSEAVQYSGRVVGPDWECPWPGRDKDSE